MKRGEKALALKNLEKPWLFSKSLMFDSIQTMKRLPERPLHQLLLWLSLTRERKSLECRIWDCFQRSIKLNKSMLNNKGSLLEGQLWDCHQKPALALDTACDRYSLLSPSDCRSLARISLLLASVSRWTRLLHHLPNLYLPYWLYHLWRSMASLGNTNSRSYRFSEKRLFDLGMYRH